MTRLIITLNDQLRYAVDPPLADRIGNQVLAEFDGRPALVFARDVRKAGGDALKKNPQYRMLVYDLEPDQDDDLMVDVSWEGTPD